MTMETVNWAASLFFLLALVMVFRFRKQISAESVATYNEIGGGLVILALVMLGRVYGDLGVFSSVPFLSDPVFYDLISWIGIITGSLLVVTGVSNWLPLARHHRKFNEARIRRLELLRRVEQLVRVETRLDQILTTTADYLVTYFDFADVAVAKYSVNRRRLYPVATTNQRRISTDQLAALQVDSERIQRYAAGRRANLTAALSGYPREADNPYLLLSVDVDRWPVAFFLLWRKPETEYDNDDI
ncbi:MAG: hypothetical protein KKA42_11415, partial [candidate division Zixibacteria bacterium]|nr:hypothetical protein [candidate division Zixibacteria bacterium]